MTQCACCSPVARAADYRALAKGIRAAENEAAPAQVARLRAEAARSVDIDFFGANGREDVEARLTSLAAPQPAPAGSAKPLVSGSGNVWVTRRDVHVDRIGSAWLIRRFIDSLTRGIGARSRCWCKRLASTNPHS
jgi:hypothetical protein